MTKNGDKLGQERHSIDRNQQISAILRQVTVARDDAKNAELRFEAYLLEMAVIALKEQLQKMG